MKSITGSFNALKVPSQNKINYLVYISLVFYVHYILAILRQPIIKQHISSQDIIFGKNLYNLVYIFLIKIQNFRSISLCINIVWKLVIFHWHYRSTNCYIYNFN